jgi:WD40 repeat protein
LQPAPKAANAEEPTLFRRLVTLPLHHKPPEVHPYTMQLKYAVRDVAFSPDGSTLAAAFRDRSLRLFDLPAGRLKLVLKDPKSDCASVAFAPHGKLSAHGGVGAEIHGASAERGHALTVQAFSRRASAFSPDGKKLAIGAYHEEFDLYDTESGERLARFDPFAGMGRIDTGLYKPDVFSLAFSPDGQLLAAYIDLFDDELPQLHRIQLWNLETGELNVVFDGQFCRFSPDGKTLVYSNRGKIELRSVETLKVLGTFGGADPLSLLDLSPDGKVVAAVANNDTVQLWEVASRKPRDVLKGDGRKINSLKFSADGTMLAAGRGDGSIEVWVANSQSSD